MVVKSVYENLPDASTVMLEESKISEDEIARREDRLREIAAEPYPDYFIDAGDVFTIKVYNNPDLEIISPVTPDGYIAMMFIGQIKIGGLTIPQAVEKVQSALAKYIKNPVVGILPTEITSQTATICGAVFKPGVYSVHGNVKLADISLMPAAALSGSSMVSRWKATILIIPIFVVEKNYSH